MRYILLLVFLHAFQVKAQHTLSEENFMAIVKKYHPIARAAAVGVQIAEAEITSSRAAFDPTLTSNWARKDFDAIRYYDQRQAQLVIPTWYGVDFYAGKEQITGNRVNPSDTKGSISFVGFSVPLVQSLVFDKRRAALQRAQILKNLSETERKIAVNDLLSDALKAYWQWWQYHQLYQLMQTASDNAKARMNMIQTAYQLGERPAIDTTEALTQVQSFALKQNEIFTELAKAQLELSTFLWKENGEQYELPGDINPQTRIEPDSTSPDDFFSLVNNHPELVQYEYKTAVLKVEKKLKFQSLLPELKLKYNQTGFDFSKTVNAPWFENNYRFGVSFSMPLRLSEGRGDYKKVKLKLHQTNLETINKKVQIYNKIRQSFLYWQQGRQQIAIQEGLLTNIGLLQKGEETKFQNGESSVFLLNMRELKTIETRQKLIELKAKNQMALVELKWSAGIFSN